MYAYLKKDSYFQHCLHVGYKIISNNFYIICCNMTSV